MRQTLNGWMWFVLGGCLFLWPSFSFADGIDDLRPDPVQSYCSGVTEIFHDAARARMVGHARKIQAVTGEQIEMMEHGIDFEFSKDAMYALGWDRLTKAEREETEMHAFSGWDSADRTIADMGAIGEDAVKRMARIYLQMCVDGHKAQPGARHEKNSFRRTASSQKIICENIAAAAERMERDFRTTEIRPEHYTNHGELARTVDRCMKDNAPVAQCVMRRCMGVGASNDAGRERFRQAVRESLQRNTEIFKRAHASPNG